MTIFSTASRPHRRRILFISGMHRSGTSFLARALNLAGLRIPRPDSSKDEWNQGGQWETTELIQASLGLFGGVDRWFEPKVIDQGPEVIAAMANAMAPHCARQDTWGWKDPRLLITLPHWLKALPPAWDAELIISLRNPLETAQSMQARNHFDLDLGLRICDRYLSQALPYAELGIPVHLFNFNAPDRMAELTRLCQRIGLEPNPAAWGEWFSRDLVNQSASYLPRMRSYHTWLERWQAQGGLADEPTPALAASAPKPKLRLAVLIADGPSGPGQPLWLKTCLEQLERNTSAYCDYKVFAWSPWPHHPALAGVSPDIKARLELLGPGHEAWQGSAGDSADGLADIDATDQGSQLQFLYDHANEHYAPTHLAILRPKAWPLRPGWDLGLLRALDGPVRLAGIMGGGQGAPPHIDPAFLLISHATVQELSLRFEQNRPDQTPYLSGLSQMVERAFGPKAILGLAPGQPGIYGNLIYIHPDAQTLNAGTSPDPAAPLYDGPWRVHTLNGRALQEPLGYFEQLLYGERAMEFGQYRNLLRGYDAPPVRRRLWELARTRLGQDPMLSFYLCGLLSRVYSYNPEFLRLYAQVCGRIGLVLDQAALNGVLNYLQSNPLGKQIATS